MFHLKGLTKVTVQIDLLKFIMYSVQCCHLRPFLHFDFLEIFLLCSLILDLGLLTVSLELGQSSVITRDILYLEKQFV